MTTIIEISKDAKKAKKSQAFEFVRQLKQGEKLTDAQLDALLLYFAPAAPKKAKTAIEWVAKAAAAQDVRKYLCYVWVSPDGVAYGTDGHCLHAAEVDLNEYPSGYYCPKTLAAVTDLDAKYPDCERVFGAAKGASNECVMSIPLEDIPRAFFNKTHCVQLFDRYGNVAQLTTALNGDASLDVELHSREGFKGAKLYDWRGNSEFGRWVVTEVRERTK